MNKEILGTILGAVAIIIFTITIIMFIYILFKIMQSEFNSKNGSKDFRTLKKENKDLQKSVDEIYEDYQDIGRMYFDLQEKVDDVVEFVKKKSNIESKEKEYILKRLEDKK